MKKYASFLAALILFFLANGLRAQGTAFTYQGQLTTTTGPATGSYDLVFTLYNTNVGGSPAAAPVTNIGTTLNNGLFTATVDFGTGVFTGQTNWLDIAVSPSGANSFVTLMPRQQLTPTPYAVFASGASAAGLSGTLPPNSLSGTYAGAVNFSNAANQFSGNGASLTALNASQLTGAVSDGLLSANVALRNGGNTFNGSQLVMGGNVGIGTASPAQTLEVNGNAEVDGTAYLDGGIVLNSANGYSQSSLGDFSVDAPSFPGGRLTVLASGNVGIGTSGPAQKLEVNGNSQVDGTAYFYGGVSLNSTNGFGQSSLGNFSVDAPSFPGGRLTVLTSGNVGIGTSGPAQKLEVNGNSQVDGTAYFEGQISLNSTNGFSQSSLGNFSIDAPSFPGGRLTVLASGNVGIGTSGPSQKLEVNGNAQVDGALTATSFSGSGGNLTGLNPADLSAGTAAINITGNAATATTATTANTATTAGSATSFTGSLAGDVMGTQTATAVAMVGGQTAANVASGTSAANAATSANTASTIVKRDGSGNFSAGTVTATLAGNGANVTSVNALTLGGISSAGFWQTTGNGGTTPGTDFIGTTDNQALEFHVNGVRALRLEPNTVSSEINVIGGSYANTVSAGISWATIAGGGTVGTPNQVTGNGGAVGGGEGNTAGTGFDATVGGGESSTASGSYSTVCGGYSHLASGSYSTVCGGDNNTAGADYSFAAGRKADAANQGAFVWADSQNATFSSTSSNSFNVRAAGGVYFVTGGTGMTIDGKVGIGTTTPMAPLDVEISSASGINPQGKNWSYFQLAGVADNGGSGYGGSPNLAIYTPGNIGASTYYAFSDARIKNILGQSDGAADLRTLLGIKVTDYTYKDTVAKGSRPQKKAIAQQVEQVYPQAVSQSTDVVPDIYQKATVQDGWVQLATNLKVGERVKLIGEQEQGIHEVLEVREGAFRTDFKSATGKVFVYGREVKDFRSVDYEAIAMLNVSATQELARKVDAQQAELSKLQDKLDRTLAERETLLKHQAMLEARDQAQEDRLARIESNMEKSAIHDQLTSLNANGH